MNIDVEWVLDYGCKRGLGFGQVEMKNSREDFPGKETIINCKHSVNLLIPI
jgi:hypothetical protein